MDRRLEHMNHCLELAIRGKSKVEPNPMVGCIVVKDDAVIGSGYHESYGGPHAEVNALAGIPKDKLKGATLYVNLEPCSHYGKTPPCTNLIISSGISKVFIGALDPNPLVAGNGRQALIKAGIEVEYGLLESECIALNKKFYHFHRTKQPWITLKWAETADGFIGRHQQEQHLNKQISNPACNPFVHQLRADHQGILIGANTANFDNPRLTARNVEGKNPIKIILSKDNRLRKDLQLFQQGKTLVFNSLLEEETEHVSYIKLNHNHFLEELWDQLYQRNIQSVLVEGGAQVLQSLIDHGWWNEAFVIHSPKVWERGIRAPHLQHEHHKSFELGDNQVFHYLKH